MLERFSQLAERTATSVSRRQFLGRFGKAATQAAGVLGCLFLVARDARAGGRNVGGQGPKIRCVSCSYECPGNPNPVNIQRAAKGCPTTLDGCKLLSETPC